MDLILKAILSHSSTFPNDLNELLHLMSDGHKNIYIPLIPLDNIRDFSKNAFIIYSILISNILPLLTMP